MDLYELKTVGEKLHALNNLRKYESWLEKQPGRKDLIDEIIKLKRSLKKVANLQS